MKILNMREIQEVSGSVKWMGVLEGAAIMGGAILAVTLAPEVSIPAAIAAVSTEGVGGAIMDLSAAM